MICSALMCHAPIVIPEIAGERTTLVSKTTSAMRSVAQEILATHPSRLVIVSPHSPRHPDAYGCFVDTELRGDFGQFGFGEMSVEVPADQKFLEDLFSTSHKLKVSIRPLRKATLDHGACVPLYFFQRAGWSGPTTVVSLPSSLNHSQQKLMAGALASAIEKQNGTTAIIASGDMSHRLRPGAPAGYHPEATQFDDSYREVITKGSYQEAALISEELRERAAEDVVDTVELVTAIHNYRAQGRRTYSYEAPFGVGYLVGHLWREEVSKRGSSSP